MTALGGFHHVRLPVSDIHKSLEWHRRVLGLEVAIEFVEDGALRGAALRDAGQSLMLALREEPGRAAALSGFDPVALGVPTLHALRAWSDRLEALGVAHSEIAEGSVGWLIGGIKVSGRETGGALTLIEQECPPGPGAFVLLPRGRPHAFANREDHPPAAAPADLADRLRALRRRRRRPRHGPTRPWCGGKPSPVTTSASTRRAGPRRGAYAGGSWGVQTGKFDCSGPGKPANACAQAQDVTSGRWSPKVAVRVGCAVY